jgi:hypothetical protein
MNDECDVIDADRLSVARLDQPDRVTPQRHRIAVVSVVVVVTVSLVVAVLLRVGGGDGPQAASTTMSPGSSVSTTEPAHPSSTSSLPSTSTVPVRPSTTLMAHPAPSVGELPVGPLSSALISADDEGLWLARVDGTTERVWQGPVVRAIDAGWYEVAFATDSDGGDAARVIRSLDLFSRRLTVVAAAATGESLRLHELALIDGERWLIYERVRASGSQFVRRAVLTGEERSMDLGFAPGEQVQRVSFGSGVFVASATALNRARTVIVAADNGPLLGVFSQFVCEDASLCGALFDGCGTTAEGCPQDVRVLTSGSTLNAAFTWRETANGTTTLVAASIVPNADGNPTARLRVTARQALPSDVQFLAFQPPMYGSVLVSARDPSGQVVTLTWNPFQQAPLSVVAVAGAAGAVAQVPPNIPIADDATDYVVAANDGLWSLRGTAAERLVDGEVSRAIAAPDGRIYFQRRSGYKDDSRPQAFLPTQTAIEIFDPATRRVSPYVMPTDGRWGHLTLHTIAFIDGAAQLLYSRLEDHSPEFGAEFGIVDWLYRRPLDGGDEVPLLAVGGYEWGTHSISYHDGIIVTSQSSEGWVAPYIVSLSAERLFSRYSWLDECANEECSFPRGRSYSNVGAMFDLAIREDGTELAWIEGNGVDPHTGRPSVALVVASADGTMRRRVELGAEAFHMSVRWKGTDRLIIQVSHVGAVGVQRYREPPARLSIVATVTAGDIDLRLLPLRGHAT